MRKLCWTALVVLLVAVATSVLYGQEGGAPGGGGRAARGGFRAPSPEGMTAMLARAGLNDKEQSAARKNMEAKFKARQALQQEFDRLRIVSSNDRSTDKQLSQAVATYRKALAKYRNTVQISDKAFARQLSIRSQARALVSGLLDNGLGRGGGGGRGGGFGGGRGDRGGGFGGGGGAAPGEDEPVP